MVKTAAKQERTAEGPGFESRLVHFYCSWGLLGCLFVPPSAKSAPRAARSAPRAAGRPQKSAQKGPRKAPGAPQVGQGPPGRPRDPPKHAKSVLEATKHCKLQCFVASEATKHCNLQCFMASKAMFFRAPEGLKHCILRVPAFENHKKTDFGPWRLAKLSPGVSKLTEKV